MELSALDENKYNSRMSSGFINKLLVGLSALDENKLDKIVTHKRNAKQPHPNNHIIAPDTALVNNAATFISAEGEIVARKIRQIQKSLSAEEIVQIILAYQNGKSANELAREYGCNRHTICEHLKKHGIEISRSKIKQEEQLKEIVTLYERGHTAAEVAKLTGLSAATIQRHLNEQGIKLRGRWG